LLSVAEEADRQAETRARWPKVLESTRTVERP
jgi:hypothetical protein